MKCAIIDSTSDLISDLPSNIVESILGYLPIQDAVRTSLLSSKWRYKWVSLPFLTFNDQNILFSTNYPECIQPYKFFNFIDRVLLPRMGPVEKFKLSISGPANYSNIDQHLLFLSKHGIREFILEIHLSEDSHKYVVPSCLFFCQQLRYLELHYCIFKPFSTNKGFSSLKTLHLENIIFGGNDQFESLISYSPLLEELIMIEFKDVTHLKIHAPNLKCLKLIGSFESICFIKTLHLVTVSICLEDMVEGAKQLEQGVTCNLIKVLGDLPGIKKLDIESYFINYLAIGNVPERLPLTCHHLKKLLFDISFNCLDEISATLCLIKSAPNLQELQITAYSDKQDVTGPVLSFLESEDDPNFFLNQLRVVKMTSILGLRPELEFIKFLLASSPLLQTMRIEVAKDNEAVSRLPKELLRLRRASALAEIVYWDNNED